MGKMACINNITITPKEVETDDNFQYRIGMEIGLIDPLEMSKESIEWYNIVGIERDNDLPIGFLYLASDNINKNVYSKPFNINGVMTLVRYAEIIDSLSDLIVVP